MQLITKPPSDHASNYQIKQVRVIIFLITILPLVCECAEPSLTERPTNGNPFFALPWNPLGGLEMGASKKRMPLKHPSAQTSVLSFSGACALLLCSWTLLLYSWALLLCSCALLLFSCVLLLCSCALNCARRSLLLCSPPLLLCSPSLLLCSPLSPKP